MSSARTGPLPTDLTPAGEKRREAARKHYEKCSANPECAAKRKARKQRYWSKYYADNQETLLARAADYAESNREYINARQRAYTARNLEKLKAKWAAEREARGSLERDPNRAGYVYIVSNPAWPGYVKIGHTKNLGKRLISYNTSSPHRDFITVGAVFCTDRFAAERQLHDQLRGHQVPRTEWFQLNPHDALQHLKRLEARL